ncbi:MAG TPA: MerR family transcriptional regulator [Ramlibacter sp.]|uniref:MerR family transcriptional regulator n=1 Tax=Ramlibacter sp. TaxID=1917967 RepID=UPI002D73B2F2|nr:MerR family transcriptional regulator [Ramlibacter sp.]HZY18589.1 MerR family transcriptional regulator [Ramlibacter sp.]
MLTSKEVLERTGISRATLNNYISTGLLPRPDVLPPSPDDGAAPRIGYFPDDTVERIAEIQRLKREGWSIARIAGRFSGAADVGDRRGATVAPIPAATRQPPLAAPLPAPLTAPAIDQSTPRASSAGAGPELSLPQIPHPAWLLDEGFGLAWLNEAARRDPRSPWCGLDARAAPAEVVKRLAAWPAPDRETGGAAIGFHLRMMGRPHPDAVAGMDGLPAALLERLQQVAAAGSAPFQDPAAHLRLPAGDASVVLHAVRFREGTLFIASPDRGAGSAALTVVPPVTAAPAPAPAMPLPALASVAVLATGLQDAGKLWRQLPAREYFELVNEIWSELDLIFRRHGGRHARHPGEGMVCYFLPEADASHLWCALAAAHQAREAMRSVSARWQARKGWDVQLCMNTGIDEGREWIGPLRSSEPVELVVLGNAADQARQLSALARAGGIWVTRHLVDRLTGAERARLTHGVPRAAGDGDAWLLSCFLPLADLVSSQPVPSGAVSPSIADLSVTEVLDLDVPAAGAPGPAAVEA